MENNDLTTDSSENEPAVQWNFIDPTWQPRSTPPACSDELSPDLPVDLDLVTGIIYPGQYRGGDFKAHGGFRFSDDETRAIEVRAPIDGYIFIASRYLGSDPTNTTDVQYLLDIVAPCGIMARLDHLTILSDKLQSAFDFLPEPTPLDSRGTYLPEPVFVERGEVLATAVGFSQSQNIFFVFGLYDLRQKNEASSKADWPSDDYGNPGQAPYALYWLDLLPDGVGDQLRSLPTGVEGDSSVYYDPLSESDPEISPENGVTTTPDRSVAAVYHATDEIDYIDAGDGIDTVVYSFARSVITKTSSGYEVDGDTLVNVERIEFSDAFVAVDTDGPSSAGGIYRLYKAAFNREPDPGGLGYWMAQADEGVKDAVRIAEDFTWSEEFQNLYGVTTVDHYSTGSDVRTLVTGFYENVLGREPDEGGLDYYTGVVESHEKSVGRVLAELSDSQENYENTIGLIQNGIPYDLWVG